MKFTLNGDPVSVDLRGGEHLLEVLREHCGVTSVKDGCAPEGSCGACTVLVDGQRGGLLRPAGRAVRRAARSSRRRACEQAGRRWADSFVAAGASQCGFCSPGSCMKAESPARQDTRPDPRARSPPPWPATCAVARATPRSSTPSSSPPQPGAASRCRRDRPQRPGRLAAPPATRALELALGDKPYRQRPDPPRDAPRRDPVRRSPARQDRAHRHRPGRRPPGRRGRAHRRRRPG